MRPHSIVGALLFSLGACAVGCGDSASNDPGAPWNPESDAGLPDTSHSDPDGAAADVAAPPPDASSDDAGGDDAAPPDAGPRADVLALMEKAADWQIAAFGTTRAKSWIEGTFYTGLMATYRSTNAPRFLDFAHNWGTANQYALGGQAGFADDQCAGQAYLEIHGLDGTDAELTSTKKSLDAMIAAPQAGRKVWWWEDALFMAGPVFTHMGKTTGDAKYYDAMSTMFLDTIAYLQDPASSLVWRDSGYFGKTCPNGQKMFWSRGNGWVVAALARILDDLPATNANHDKLLDLYKTITTKIATLQKADGYWPSCLTDATAYPNPESSGTAAFAFAIAWGVNRGLLDRVQYAPIANKAWAALAKAVGDDGKLGWVQAVGAAPGDAKQTDTAPYAVGLFLLAGSEVAVLPP